MKKYYFMATETGEVVSNIFAVVRVTIENFRYYRFITIRNTIQKDIKWR